MTDIMPDIMPGASVAVHLKVHIICCQQDSALNQGSGLGRTVVVFFRFFQRQARSLWLGAWLYLVPSMLWR